MCDLVELIPLLQQIADMAGEWMASHKVKFIRSNVPTKVELIEKGPPCRLKVEYKNTQTGEIGTEEFNTVSYCIPGSKINHPNEGDEPTVPWGSIRQTNNSRSSNSAVFPGRWGGGGGGGGELAWRNGYHIIVCFLSRYCLLLVENLTLLLLVWIRQESRSQQSKCIHT